MLDELFRHETVPMNDWTLDQSWNQIPNFYSCDNRPKAVPTLSGGAKYTLLRSF